MGNDVQKALAVVADAVPVSDSSSSSSSELDDDDDDERLSGVSPPPEAPPRADTPRSDGLDDALQDAEEELKLITSPAPPPPPSRPPKTGIVSTLPFKPGPKPPVVVSRENAIVPDDLNDDSKESALSMWIESELAVVYRDHLRYDKEIEVLTIEVAMRRLGLVSSGKVSIPQKADNTQWEKWSLPKKEKATIIPLRNGHFVVVYCDEIGHFIMVDPLEAHERDTETAVRNACLTATSDKFELKQNVAYQHPFSRDCGVYCLAILQEFVNRGLDAFKERMYLSNAVVREELILAMETKQPFKFTKLPSPDEEDSELAAYRRGHNERSEGKRRLAVMDVSAEEQDNLETGVERLKTVELAITRCGSTYAAVCAKDGYVYPCGTWRQMKGTLQHAIKRIGLFWIHESSPALAALLFYDKSQRLLKAAGPRSEALPMENYGRVCYILATLQCLNLPGAPLYYSNFSDEELLMKWHQEAFRRDNADLKSRFMIRLITILYRMYDPSLEQPTGVEDLVRVMDVMWRSASGAPQFPDIIHHDASEFLTQLIDVVSEKTHRLVDGLTSDYGYSVDALDATYPFENDARREIKLYRKENDMKSIHISPIADSIGQYTMTERWCTKPLCPMQNKKIQKCECHVMSKIPIIANADVKQCIDEEQRVQKVDAKCVSHEKTPWAQERRIVPLYWPAVFIIALERFKFSAEEKTEKVRKWVEINETMDLGGVKYELVSTCCHGGASASNGHYIAAILRHEDKKWRVYNDDKKAEQRVNLNRNYHPYLLVYRRVAVARKITAVAATMNSPAPKPRPKQPPTRFTDIKRTNVYVFWGPRGSGKMAEARTLCAGEPVFVQDPRKNWLEGHQGETNVIVEGYRGNYHIKLLRELVEQGHYGLRRVIFLSTMNPEEWYPDDKVGYHLFLKGRGFRWCEHREVDSPMTTDSSDDD